jgi:hypothetical protein
MKSENIVPT